MKYLKIGLVVIFLISCIVLGIKYGMNIKYVNDMHEINSMRNTFLDDYNANKEIVKSYLQVYEIRNETTYQAIKNTMYNSLSKDLQEEIFPTVNYEGLALHPLKTEIIRCIGTNNGPDFENTFLLEYNLSGVNYNQNISNLVTLKNGIITSVVRIK